MTELTLAPIDGASTALAETKGPTLSEVAMAVLGGIKPTLIALAARYKDVAYDLTTPAGLEAAKAARHDLRENGRYAVQRARDELKERLNSTKDLVIASAEDLIAIVQSQEDQLDTDIKAREKEITEAKATAKRIAEERKARLDADLARIESYVPSAREKARTAEWLATVGIPFADGLTIDPEVWGADYTPRATAALKAAQDGLRALHEQVKAREDAAAAVEAQRLENERVARELAEARAALEAQMAAMREAAEALAVAQAAEAAERQAAADKLAAEERAAEEAEGAIEAARQADEIARLEPVEQADPGALPDFEAATVAVVQEAVAMVAAVAPVEPTKPVITVDLDNTPPAPPPVVDPMHVPSVSLSALSAEVGVGFKFTEQFIETTLGVIAHKQRSSVLYTPAQRLEIFKAASDHFDSLLLPAA